jgi:SWI/SNF-related matrix-associated actin-dependent regulator 1 of chromatin subfamily A
MEATYMESYGIARIVIPYMPEGLEPMGTARKQDNGSIHLELNAWNLRRVRKHMDMDVRLRRIYSRMFTNDKAVNINIKIKGTLLPFQEEGCIMIEKQNGVALLADDMGLGKTVQAIAWVTAKKAFPCLILCPAHLKWNWDSEFRKFAPNVDVEVLSGTKPYMWSTEEVVVINYEIIQYWQEALQKFAPICVIADEFHAVKNKGSIRAKATDTVMSVAQHRIGITGTPMKTGTKDLWNQMRLIDRHVLGGWSTFAQEFCDAKRTFIFKRTRTGLRRIPVMDTNGTSNGFKLHKMLERTYMIRRTKSSVALQLPKKVRSIIKVDLGRFNREYMKLEDEYIKMRKAGSVQEEMKSFARMRIESGRAKLATGAIYNWIDAFLERESKPLIVVCWHREAVVDVIFSKYRNISTRITGAESAKQKHEAASQFQKGKYRILVCNVQSAGTGLTLTKTDVMLFVELPVDAADLEQMEDRICRISQTSEMVNYYYFVVLNSLEQRIIEIVDRKKTNASLVIDGQQVKVEELLKNVKQAI